MSKNTMYLNNPIMWKFRSKKKGINAPQTIFFFRNFDVFYYFIFHDFCQFSRVSTTFEGHFRIALLFQVSMTMYKPPCFSHLYSSVSCVLEAKWSLVSWSACSGMCSVHLPHPLLLLFLPSLLARSTWTSPQSRQSRWWRRDGRHPTRRISCLEPANRGLEVVISKRN